MIVKHDYNNESMLQLIWLYYIVGIIAAKKYVRPFRSFGKWNHFLFISASYIFHSFNYPDSLCHKGGEESVFFVLTHVLCICINTSNIDCDLKQPVCVLGCSCSLCIYCFVDTLVWPRAKQPHQHVFYDGMVGRVSHSARQRNQWWIYTRPGTLVLHNEDCQSSLH